jgi:protein-tyrosine phosphatase
MLGVPRETIFEDYLATNVYTAATTESRIKSVGALLYDPELLRPLIEARREYLQSSFDAVEDEYGSFDKYLTKGLGIDKATQAKIRANLLAD